MNSTEQRPTAPAGGTGGTVRERLAATAAQLSARRDALTVQLGRARAAAEHADQRVHTADDHFRSSSDGLAESLRSIEQSAISKEPAAAIRRCQRLHVAAEEASAQEYQRRTAAWGHTAGDGPLRACPLGADSALAVVALRDHVMATYRHDPSAHTVRVRLLRVVDGHRYRMTVQIDRGTELTVCGVLRVVLGDAQLRTRLSRSLKVDVPSYREAVGST